MAAPQSQGAVATRFAVVGVSLVVAGGAFAMMAGAPKPVAVSAPAFAGEAPAEASVASQPAAELNPAAGFASADSSRTGIASYNAGDVATAINQFTAAVEADPSNAEALNNLGQMLVRSGRAREAIPYFDRAIVIAADVWSYRFNRARAYGELEEWRQAIAGYTEAARLFPDDYVTQFNLARARQAVGDLPGAVEAYARATELAPGQADFHLWYGQALDQQGRVQEAAAAYQRFLELDPDAPQAEKVRARLQQMKVPQAPASSVS